MSHLVGPGEAERVRWTLDIVQARVDLPGLRVLDLACRTGAFATAFAHAGATVHGIEARQENLDHVPPSSVTYELGDVRDLSPDHGRYDVVLCLGILYHLEPADALHLLVTMRQVTERFAVVDTHVGSASATVEVDGQDYHGHWFHETPGHPWSAVRNTVSWWFTEQSLADAVHAAGWDNIEPRPGRSWSGEAHDRRWLVIS